MTQTAGGPQEPQGQGDGARGYSGRKEDWIANQLRKVYDDALHEPIPKEMLDLLDALDGAVAKEFFRYQRQDGRDRGVGRIRRCQ